MPDVGRDRLEGVIPLHSKFREVLGEKVTDDAQRQIGFCVEGFRCLAGLRLLLNHLPLRLETVDVPHQFLGCDPLSCGTHDHRLGVTDQLAQDLPQPGALHVRELAGDPGQVPTWGVDDVTAG